MKEHRGEMDDHVMLDEYWVTFEEFPNYSISNYGRVVNNATSKELRPHVDSFGNHKVAFYRDGNRYEFGVHRLVARAFFVNYREGVQVKHINGDKSENTVLNLTLGVRPVRTHSKENKPW